MLRRHFESRCGLKFGMIEKNTLEEDLNKMAAPKAEKTTKPRKAPAKKKTAADAPEPIFIRPSHDQIAALAQKYWAERGYADGHAEHDWLRAEQDLMKAS
jgi:Protein of unknown function (DUF2934)